MEITIPYHTDALPAHYARNRVLLRGMGASHQETVRRIRDGAIAAEVSLANGRPVTTDADALNYVLELAAAAAE